MLRDAWDRAWYGLQIAPAHQRLFRLAFFGVLAVDSVAFGSRAGFAGPFNVTQLGALDPLAPIPPAWLLGALWLVQAALAARLALGAGGRRTLLALLGLYLVTWLWSLADGYQHRYLLLWALIILAPWRPDGEGPAWPLRLLVTKLAIVYGYAAVAKLDPAWWDGIILQHVTVLTRTPRVVEGFAHALSIAPATLWQATSVAVLVLEVTLAALLLVRRTWPLAACLALPFHLALIVLDLPIGRFAPYLVATHLLLLPAAWLRPVLRWFETEPLERLRAPLGPVAGGVLVAVAAAAYLAIGLPGAPVAALAVALALGIPTVRAERHRRLAQVAAAGLGAALILTTAEVGEVARDTHANRALDLRVRGDLEGALAEYRAVLAEDGGYVPGWVVLGDVALEAGRPAEAAAAYAMASSLAPNDEALAALARETLAQVAGPEDAPPPDDLLKRARAGLTAGQPGEAARKFLAACETGSAAGCAGAGGLYATGRGVPRDDARALALYRRACSGGDPSGCANLGYLIAEGRGVEADPEAARALLERGCRGGDSFGCRELSRRYP